MCGGVVQGEGGGKGGESVRWRMQLLDETFTIVDMQGFLGMDRRGECGRGKGGGREG